MDIVSYIRDLFCHAISQRSSDIHIEPQAEMLRIRQRVDGFLVETDEISPDYASPIISRLKVMGNLDIGEKRVPQDGAMTITQDGMTVDVRISTIPTLHGEKVVLRLLKNRSEAITLDELGIAAEERDRLLQLLTRSSGLIIVTGPTGSGKTTTLYAMLQFLNKAETNLVTLEDPIELQLAGVNQIQIHPKAGLTFAQGLRAILRQDPNVIMIGEIRDKETADISIGAALTGHLVLSTLHTVDGASAVTRLLDMKMEPYRIAAALSGVIAQRLVRLRCRHCQGKKCPRCHQTGYSGRTGAFEVISIGEEMERLIVKQSSLTEMRQLLRAKGMRSLDQVLLTKVKQEETTFEEFVRVIDDVDKACMEL